MTKKEQNGPIASEEQQPTGEIASKPNLDPSAYGSPIDIAVRNGEIRLARKMRELRRKLPYDHEIIYIG